MSPARTISVAMCTYNGERYLRDQLLGIARQSQPPSELVICDDGSTDSTLEIVSEFSRTAPFAVRLTRNSKTLKSTKNFEQAIRLCAGELIALCDQDDIWRADKLEVQAGLLERSPETGGIFSDAEIIDASTVPIGQNLWAGIPFGVHAQKRWRRGGSAAILLRSNVVTGATLMFRSALRPLFLPIAAEWTHDAWIAWMLVLYSKLEPIRTPLIRYRIHAGQQIGIERFGPSAQLPWRKRFEVARRVEPQKHLKQATEMQILQHRLIELNNSQKWLISSMEEKIRFLNQRARPHPNRFYRALHILASAPHYQRYEFGWRPWLRDIALLFL